MIRKIIFILVGCLVALSSCQWDGKSGNTADVDVRVARYDRLQYEYVTMNSFSALQKMNTDYPQVTKLLIEDVLAIGEVDDMKINDRMLEYYSDSTLLTLMHDAEEKFKDLSWVEEKLTKERFQTFEERGSCIVCTSFLCSNSCAESVGCSWG